MKGLRRDIGTVRPGYGAAFEEEPREVVAIFERLKHWTDKPFREVDRCFDAVVEGELDAVVTAILGSNDHGKGFRHSGLIPAARTVRVILPISCGSNLRPVRLDAQGSIS